MSLFTLQVSDQEQYGPVALETLKIWIREGSVKQDSSIYDHTQLKWVRASEIPQIMELFHPPIAPSQSTVEPIPVAKETVPKTVRVASKTQTAKVSGHTTSRSHGASGKTKMMRPGRTENIGDSRKASGKIKRPTVLARLKRILIGPFSKGASEAPKKQSQKIK